MFQSTVAPIRRLTPQPTAPLLRRNHVCRQSRTNTFAISSLTLARLSPLRRRDHVCRQSRTNTPPSLSARCRSRLRRLRKRTDCLSCPASWPQRYLSGQSPIVRGLPAISGAHATPSGSQGRGYGIGFHRLRRFVNYSFPHEGGRSQTSKYFLIMKKIT